MKKLIRVLMLAAVVVALPIALFSRYQDEEKMWQWAQTRDEVRAYDLYLLDHPDGAHAGQVWQKARERSVAGLHKAALSCDPMFPRMVYYSTWGEDGALVAPEALSRALADAAACRFSRSLDEQERLQGVAGLLMARPWIEQMVERGLPIQTLIDLNLVMLDLEEAVIGDCYSKIVRCMDQSAWQDTCPKQGFLCSLPHRLAQSKMAQAIADQARNDFDRIAQVDDHTYRLGFWTIYKKWSKKQSIETIAFSYELANDAYAAYDVETDATIKKEIQGVAVNMSATGKPVPPYRFDERKDRAKQVVENEPGGWNHENLLAGRR